MLKVVESGEPDKTFDNQPAGPRGPMRDFDSTPPSLSLGLKQYHIFRIKCSLKQRPPTP